DNPTPHVGKIESTNPCVTGDTSIATENGLIPAKELKEGMNIWTPRGLRSVSKVFNNGVQDVYLVTTKAGFSLKATPNHKLFTPDRDWVKVSELKEGDLVSLFNKFEYSFHKSLPKHFHVMDLRERTGFLLPLEFVEKYGYILGILTGNGYYSTATAFYFGQRERELYLKTKYILDDWKIPYRIRRRGKITVVELSKSIRRLWKILGASPGKSRNRKVPVSIFGAPEPVVKSFLRALFSCSGTIDSSRAIRLSSASIELLKEVQLLLLGFSIKGKIYTRSREREYAFVYVKANGEEKKYPERDYYELIISRESRDKFAEKIGFYLFENEEKLKKREGIRSRPEIWSDQIKSMQYAGREEVFDLTEPETLTWITNGFISLDCGEQPLLPYESCLAPETRIFTDKGWERIDKVYKRQQKGQKILVYTDRILKNSAGLDLNPAIIVPVGKREVVRLELSNGLKLRLTPDHKILTQRGWLPVEELEESDYVYIMKGAPYSGSQEIDQNDEAEKEQRDFYQMLGWLVGDGWHTKNSSGLVFAPKDYKAKEKFLSLWQKLARENIADGANGKIPYGSTGKNGVTSVTSKNIGLRELLNETGLTFAKSREKRIPSSIFTLNLDCRIAFLKGLFAAEGSINSQRATVRLTTSSQDLAQDVQLLLLSLGMKSRIHNSNHRNGRNWRNVSITSDGLEKFSQKIGFPFHFHKQQRMENWIESRMRIRKNPRRMRVKNIVPDGTSFVYDVYEPKTDSLIAEGIIVHNCNLASINLAKMVEDGRVN
ncbi:MAG: LAGLIDADG family homing endonuclease, partial [bacterium]